MPAVVVSKAQIDLLVTAGLKFGRTDVTSPMRWEIPNSHPTRELVLTRAKATEIGSILWAENVLSALERHPLEEIEGMPACIGDFGPRDLLLYRFEETTGPLDPVVVLKQVANYAHACEHDALPHSAARAFCELLTQRLITALPGYEAAPWGFDDPQFFARRAYREALKGPKNPA